MMIVIIIKLSDFWLKQRALWVLTCLSSMHCSLALQWSWKIPAHTPSLGWSRALLECSKTLFLRKESLFDPSYSSLKVSTWKYWFYLTILKFALYLKLLLQWAVLNVLTLNPLKPWDKQYTNKNGCAVDEMFVGALGNSTILGV